MLQMLHDLCVCLRVCLFVVTTVSCAKMAEPIEIPFGVWTWVRVRVRFQQQVRHPCSVWADKEAALGEHAFHRCRACPYTQYTLTHRLETFELTLLGQCGKRSIFQVEGKGIYSVSLLQKTPFLLLLLIVWLWWWFSSFWKQAECGRPEDKKFHHNYASPSGWQNSNLRPWCSMPRPNW